MIQPEKGELSTAGNENPAGISGKALGINALWNFLGVGLPTLVALIAIPFLIKGMGEARFGVLMLAWLVFGYFSIFDFGLYRALTQLVSELLGAGREDELAPVFWTALLIMAIAGLFGTLVVGLSSEALVYRLLRIPDELKEETLWAFRLMAAGLPVLVSAAGMRGVAEAHQRFRSIFYIQLWQGLWTFGGPLLVIQFTTHMGWIVSALLFGRLISWIAYFILNHRIAPQIRKHIGISYSFVRPLLTYGGWMTLTHMVIPIILYGDRMVIGAMLSVTAVTYYTTPAEIVIKLLIIPNAMMGVLFPVFAASYLNDPRRTQRFFQRGMRLLFFSYFPVAMIGVTVAPEFLNYWLNKEFAAQSTIVLQLLIMGVFYTGLSIIPVGLIQGIGRPDIITKAYLLELPLAAGLLYCLIHPFGIEGVAFTWFLRAFFDCLLVLVLSCKSVKLSFNVHYIIAGLLSLITLISLMLIELLRYRILLLGFYLTFFFLWGWNKMLEKEEKKMLFSLLNITTPGA